MTLRQKASFVVLRTRPPLENTNDGIPSLCIPPLTLTDGPNGIAFHMRGVTQLPAAIGVAATFDPSVARATGTVMGQEAKTKGINAVQGPELNLARVPQAGRIFEAFGENPFLTGVMGVANVEGIQSTGTMANLKHATGYTQETARYILDQKISQRALDELYNPPFQAVFASIPVASVMCSYGSINGVNDCSDPKLYTDLTSWGFSGFVRSDLGAVPRTDTASALNAGIALIKPSSTDGVLRLVRSGAVSVHSLDADVAKSLTQMFRYGLVAHPDRVRARANAITEAHTKAALTTAEESAVLLKNAGQVLPIESAPKSVAVIGTGAMDPITSGGGSSAVKAPFVSTPLSALRSSLGHATRINYAPGALRSVVLRSITTGIEVPRSSFDASPPSLHSARVESGKDDLSVVESPNVTPAAATATSPSTGRSWSSWSQTITPRSSGIYRVGLRQVGDTWLTIDGKPVISSPGLHTPTTLSADVHLTKGVPYHFAIRWFAVDFRPPPAFGIRDETPLFDAAVDAARKSRVAVVFAGEFQTEGSDRPLGLPGDLDALISAIAAVNPRTIVVVNSGGAVLMPWLSQVAAVVEDWYPGEEDGAAIAAVLTGRVDPSGRLPITFPSASVLHAHASAVKNFPGVDATVHFETDLNIGYRRYQADHLTPLFPFGFGLSYTSFSLSELHVAPNTTGGWTVTATDTNTGHRSGSDVIQAYLGYPPGLGEPPQQLRAFTRVTLSPGASKTVTMVLPQSAFTNAAAGKVVVTPGQYAISVGESSSDLPLHTTVRVN